MSEDNGNNLGAQWSKGSVIARAAIPAHQFKLYELPENVGPTSGASANLTNVNESSNSSSIGVPPYGTTNICYPAARFQAPPIHPSLSSPIPSVPQILHPHNPNSTTTVLTSAPATSNVPVPSGFVPPVPFSNAPAPAVTSVLTPNPFAAVNNLSNTQNVNTAAPFALEQFQHLNASRYEMSKIMNAAMGSTAAPLSLTSTSTPVMNQSSQAQALAMGRLNPEMCSSSAGAISSSLSESVINTFSTGGGLPSHITPTHNRILGIGVRAPDVDKMQKIQQMVEAAISDSGKQKIAQILDGVGTLKPVERLLLYLRLPGETPETDPLRQPQNPLGTRSEINHTINWVRSHLEHDPNVSIPKQDVYNEYTAYCERLDIKPLSTADFGKVMKQVFPGLKPRRLGTRGHSRYCYAAMRKTTKLPAPQLPLVTSSNISASSQQQSVIKDSQSQASNLETQLVDCDTWDVIKNWSENMLNIKIDSVQDLATRIRTGATIGNPNILRSTNTAPKKYSPREPKEKRLQTDMGPLKKRRKKKRKGSSSSESSCSQAQSILQNNNNNLPLRSPNTSMNCSSSIVTSEDEKSTTMKTIDNIKQEIDSPKCQQSGIIQPQIPIQHIPKTEVIKDNYLTTTQPQPQHQPYNQHQVKGNQYQQPLLQPQLMPINLATEQRTVLAKAPPALQPGVVTPLVSQSPIPSAFVSRNLSANNLNLAANYGAVKNLTPKIIELSNASLDAMNSASSAGSTISEEQQQQIQATLQNIKEEADDYNPTVLCKKVLKAHQTKGFWVNSPSSSNSSTSTNNNNNMSTTTPMITTTSATPPPTSMSSTTSSGLEQNDDQFLMGPPTQSTRISPSFAVNNSENDLPFPKVASKNYLFLKAKRMAALRHAAIANEAPTPDLDKNADLPEDLGLPRERVISICNMDKHELDGYLIPNDDDEEEENSQETELLQYFQRGDVEEKKNLNSLNDADQQQRNPAMKANALNQNQTSSAAKIVQQQQQPLEHQESIKQKPSNGSINNNQQQQQLQQQQKQQINLNLGSLSSINNSGGKSSLSSAWKPIGLISQQQQQQQQLDNLLITNPNQQHSQQLQQQSLKTQQEKNLIKQIQTNKQQQMIESINEMADSTTNRITTSTLTTTSSAAVSASASLALMSKRHQIQQEQQLNEKLKLLNQQKTSSLTNSLSKRKIQVGSLLNTNETLSQAARKNYTFLPISPNINTSSNQQNATSSSYTNAHNNNNNTTNNSVCFASPGVGRLRARTALLNKQQSLDCDTNCDPMIGATRRRRSYVNSLNNLSANGALTTSASAPPSPSVYQQFLGNTWLNNRPQTTLSINDSATEAFLQDQDSVDIDLFKAANAAMNTFNSPQNSTNNGFVLDEIQRSQSVPLSQLQRSRSPLSFERKSDTQNYSACPSVAQTPIPPELIEPVNHFSENSNSQNSNQPNSSALLEIDEILTFSDFAINTESSSRATTATTCSSAGSSSGYSSGACTTLGNNQKSISSNLNNLTNSSSSSSGGIISRSVPSTPLPYHSYNLFGNSSPLSSHARNSSTNENKFNTKDDSNQSPSFTVTSFINSSNNLLNNNQVTLNHRYSNYASVRSSYDISKSMPTTPITTPSFSYSPTDFTQDFLINGNTIDSLTPSSFNNANESNFSLENATATASTNDLSNLTADSLNPLDPDNVINSLNEVDSIIGTSELLDSF